MVWPLAAMAVTSFMGANKEQAAKLNAQAERAADEMAQNQAIAEANAKNFRRSLLRTGMLNVQRGQQKQQLEQRKADASAGELQALGSSSVSAAASGTVGASVDAVQSDIQMQFDAVRAQISQENELAAQDFNTNLYDMLEGTRDSMQSVRAISKVGKYSLLQSITAGVVSAGTAYAGAKMDLGLGRN